MSISVQIKLTQGDFELDAAFTAPAKAITAVFGRSGAGKSTLLRVIAGLEHGSGSIHVEGETWLSAECCLPVHARAIGYVFQEASLFDHLTVQGNLEYGLKRIPVAERRITFAQVISVLELDKLLQRNPATLSGGERQRVAIGRALLTSPKLLLLDEPLASLDIQHKREIMPLLESMWAEFGIPAIYVSHAPDEIARLADHLVLLDKGQVIAAGPTNEILTSLDLPLAHGHEAGSVIETSIGEYDSEFDLTVLNIGKDHLQVPGLHEAGRTLKVQVLARDVSLALERPANTSILNILPATITGIAVTEGPQSLVKLDIGGNPLLAQITRRSLTALQLKPGKTVYAQIKTVALLNS